MHRFSLAVFMLLTALLPAAVAQETAGLVELKNRAPVSDEILRVHLPEPVSAELSNGLTVLIIEDHRLPLVSVQYNISGAGPLYEPAAMPGLASMTAQMMREGTSTRTSPQIAAEIELLGAALSVTSGFGSSAAVLSASGLSDNFENWFRLANDVLLNPSFPERELELLKQRMRASLRQQRSAPDFLLTERFNGAVYGDHPAANVSATAAAIDDVTPEMLAEWHRTRYAPHNSILGIAGDVDAETLIPRLEQWLSAWERTNLEEVLPPHPQPASARQVHLVDRPDSAQTSLAMGNVAIDRRDPDYVPFLVALRVLGGGSSGRLFLNLREERGYTYGAYSYFTALKYPGMWMAYADVRTEVTDGALTEFIREIDRMSEEPVPEDELTGAKRAVAARFALSLEDRDQLLSYAIIRQIYGFPEDYWDAYPARIMEVSAADVQRVARKYLDPDVMQIVAVGDGARILPILEEHGPVQRYDIEGRRLQPAP